MEVKVEAAATEPLGRWIADWQRDGHRGPADCTYCGRANSTQTPDCRPTTCRACGSRQCMPSSECRVCLVGLVPEIGYSYGTGRPWECGYAKCHKEPVATAPRVRWVCVEHLSRPTRRYGGYSISVAEEIAERIAARDRNGYISYNLHRMIFVPEVTR